MVKVQVAHDHSADIADAVAGRCQRVVEVMLVVVDIARERFPRRFRPFLLGVLGAVSLEQDRPGLRVLDDRCYYCDPAALIGRVRVGLNGSGGTADEEAVAGAGGVVGAACRRRLPVCQCVRVAAKSAASISGVLASPPSGTFASSTANPPVEPAWPSLTVLPWPAVGGERGGGAGQEEGGGEHDGGDPEAVQDAYAVAEETNYWRPGEEGHVAD